MAHHQKGDRAEARKWFDKAVAWTKENDPKNIELRGFWTEAAKLVGQPGPAPLARTRRRLPRSRNRVDACPSTGLPTLHMAGCMARAFLLGEGAINRNVSV
jgi:hypothetical protein